MNTKEILEHLIELADKGFYNSNEFNSAWETFYQAKSTASESELQQALRYAQENTEVKFKNFPNPDYYIESLEDALERNYPKVEA